MEKLAELLMYNTPSNIENQKIKYAIMQELEFKHNCFFKSNLKFDLLFKDII